MTSDQTTADILDRLARHPLEEWEQGVADDIRAAVSEIERLRAENADLRTSVVAFGGVWAATHARETGLPDGHLHAVHFDILRRAGARMTGFQRFENVDD